MNSERKLQLHRTYRADKALAEIDPLTGVIKRVLGRQYSLDGLTFDSFTGHLFASSLYRGRIVEYDPQTLTEVRPYVLSAIETLPDGLTSDGQGNIFVADRMTSQIFQFNIPATRQRVAPRYGTALTYIYGLDDLALLGLGAMRRRKAPSVA